MSAPPPLELTPLLQQSKIQVLKELAALVHRYNFLFRTFVLQKSLNPDYTLDGTGVSQLDKMSLLVLAYLVAKPQAARSAKGHKRWDDIVAFKGQLEAHARYFNIKLLHGDMARSGDEDDDTANYWFERLDPANNGLDQLDEFLAWMKTKQKEVFKGSGDTPDLHYLSDLERARYRVEAHANRVYDAAGEQLNTQGARATYGDTQDAHIYVCCAMTRKVYSFASAFGEMHHSSMLKGKPVLAAGAWKVCNGEVLFVDGLSGHYRPTADNLRTFARTCQEFWSPRTLIQPWPDRDDAVSMKNFILLGDAAPVVAPAKVA
jgi:hypothetical protein